MGIVHPGVADTPVLHGTEAAKAFMDAFRDAPDDADIEIGIGEANTIPRFLVSAKVSGVHAVFTPGQARVIANTFEKIMRAFASANVLDGTNFPDMVMGLRLCADKADLANSSAEQTNQHAPR